MLWRCREGQREGSGGLQRAGCYLYTWCLGGINQGGEAKEEELPVWGADWLGGGTQEALRLWTGRSARWWWLRMLRFGCAGRSRAWSWMPSVVGTVLQTAGICGSGLEAQIWDHQPKVIWNPRGGQPLPLRAQHSRESPWDQGGQRGQ